MQGDAAFSLLNTLLGPSARLRRARDERVSDLRHPRWLAPAALSIFGAAEPRADSIEKARMLSVGHALKFRIVKNALRAFFTIRNFRRRAPQARASVGAGIRHSLKTQHLYKNYACKTSKSHISETFYANFAIFAIQTIYPAPPHVLLFWKISISQISCQTAFLFIDFFKGASYN